MITQDKLIRKYMKKLCLKSKIGFEKVAYSCAFWIGKYCQIAGCSDEKQIEIIGLLNEGFSKGLFGEEL